MNRRPAVLSPVLATAALVALAATAAAANWHVHIQNFSFSPNTQSVAVGDTVTWDNHDFAPHTATSRDIVAFDTRVLDNGETFTTAALDVQRAVFYWCTIHLFTGRVIVGNPPAGADLVVSSLTVEEGDGLVPGVPGFSKHIVLTVSNYGLSTAGASVAKLQYRSAGLGGTWKDLSSFNVQALSSGDGTPAADFDNDPRTPITFDWDTFGLAGDFEVRVVADANQQVAEANENNNELASVTTVLLPVGGVPGVNVFDPL